MPTKCDECGEKSYTIHITREYKKLCGDCYDKVRPPYKFDPDDIPYRERVY